MIILAISFCHLAHQKGKMTRYGDSHAKRLQSLCCQELVFRVVNAAIAGTLQVVFKKGDNALSFKDLLFSMPQKIECQEDGTARVDLQICEVDF